MNPLDFIHGVELIADVCLEVKAGQTVLCIADREEYLEILSLVAAQCRARGAEPAVVLIEPRTNYYREPPKPIALAMEKADIVVTMTFGSLVHTAARRNANAAGAKIAIMGEVTREYLIGFDLSREDLLKVCEQTEMLVDRLTRADSAHLTTQAGTDLSMSLKGRKGVGLIPIISKGTFCGVPGYAEAACPPLEESVDGVVVIDGATVGTPEFEALVEEPFKIEFRKGKIASISASKDGLRLERLLSELEDGARTFAELGVNSNFMVPKKLRGSRLDMAVGGHVHIGIGRNNHIGGRSMVESHLDMLLTWATLALDGEIILENGALKI